LESYSAAFTLSIDYEMEALHFMVNLIQNVLIWLHKTACLFFWIY